MIPKVILEDIAGIGEEFREQLGRLGGKTVLITGANGFIPSYIVDVIADFNRGNTDKCHLVLVSKNPIHLTSRLGHLLKDPYIKFIAADVGRDFEVIGKPDIILHAASRANPIFFLKDPIDTIDANANGTRTLLEYSARNPIENFVLFSSAEVYGDPPKEFLPTPESYGGNVNCLEDTACYSESKRFSETLCRSFFREIGTPIQIARIFHTYGPGLRDDGKTLTRFFQEARKTKRIVVKGDGSERRSYAYVADTVRGIFTMMFNGEHGEAYNVGDDTNNVSVGELARLVAKVMEDPDIGIEHDLGARVYIGDRMPDITKLKSIGFSPKVVLYDGLYRTRRYFEEVSKQ